MTGTRMHVVRAVAQLSIGIAPVCLFGFIRVGTNRRIFTDPLAVDGLQWMNPLSST